MEMSSVPPLTSRNPSSSTVSEFDFQYISPRSTSQKRGGGRIKRKNFPSNFPRVVREEKGGRIERGGISVSSSLPSLLGQT